MKKDSNALMCDFAETYHIYNIFQLSPSRAAVFAMGLRADSRIKTSLGESKLPLKETLLAGILDTLNLLLWRQTGDSSIECPKSILKLLLEEDEESQEEAGNDDTLVFESADDFEKERTRLLAMMNRRE